MELQPVETTTAGWPATSLVVARGVVLGRDVVVGPGAPLGAVDAVVGGRVVVLTVDVGLDVAADSVRDIAVSIAQTMPPATITTTTTAAVTTGARERVRSGR